MSDKYERTNTPGIYKDVVTKKYWIKFDYQDFTGVKRTVKKRGFKKIKDAIDFKIDFLQNQASSSSIRFSAFYESYINDMSKRLRKNTVENKKYIIELKILPYFGKKKINEITPRDIRMWQGTLLKSGYKETYLKTINNQLSAMFNYACRFYGLNQNPCKLAGSIGKSKADEMEIFTREEFTEFLNCLYDKPESHLAFEILFYTGMRVSDADGKISLNQQKPSKHAGVRRFGPEKFLQRNNEFMKERPIFYKKPIKTEKDFSTWLRCFYYTTKAVITEYIYF